MSEARRRELTEVFERALAFAERQARRILARRPGLSPMYTTGGVWDDSSERWTHWCEGFFPGILWLLYRHTGDDGLCAHAEALSRKLEPRRHDRDVHDLGFLFFSTYLRWYHLTGDPRLRDVLTEAGRTLALRRQPGGYLASFLGPSSLFIDVMMNVGLSFWAARASGDEGLRQIALEHCQVTARHLVREDGSTAHEGLFDAEGRFLGQSTQQGLGPGSRWSRGLAWSLYGFTSAWRFTGEAGFLDVARANADCWLSLCPQGRVPPWDFDAPEGGSTLRDSSACAIAASGLWDLWEATGDERYQAASLAYLESLCDEEYLAEGDAHWEGILKHAVYHLHRGLGVDESVAWGDHFFVEALVKARHGRSAAAW
jgi:unsaturated chondroitin disaccharide hydrolase